MRVISLVWLGCRRWVLSSKKQRATRNWRRMGRSEKRENIKDERIVKRKRTQKVSREDCRGRKDKF